MTDLLTKENLKAKLREDVKAAGGALKWLKKHDMSSQKYVAHMYDNGDAATFPETLRILGYQPVTMYAPHP